LPGDPDDLQTAPPFVMAGLTTRTERGKLTRLPSAP
jgi:hypothetical protein